MKPSHNLQTTNARDRSYYERQGAEALAGQAAFHCSEDSVVAAVLEMAAPYFDEFDAVLDVGCGANLAYNFAIARQGKRVYGIDFAMNFLRLAPKDRLGIYLAQADALKLPFRDGAFGAAICSETIEHIPDESAAIAEVARVLRPHGLLFVTVPNLLNADRLIRITRTRDFTIRLMEGHVREYSPHRLRRLLASRFVIEKRIPVGFHWTGRYGAPLERLLKLPGFRRFGKSIALVARKR
jgi:SAM-dependent methyltransferase